MCLFYYYSQLSYLNIYTPMKFNCRLTSKKNITRYPSYAALQQNRINSEQKENLGEKLSNNQLRKQNFWKRKIYNQNNIQNHSNNVSIAQRNRRTQSTKVNNHNMSEFGQIIVSNPFQSIDKQLDGIHQLEKVLFPYQSKFRVILKHQKQHLKEAEMGIQQKTFKISNYKIILDKLLKNLQKALESPIFQTLNHLKCIFTNYVGVAKQFQDKLLNEVHELRETRIVNPTQQFTKLQKEHNLVSDKLFEMTLYSHALELYNNKNSNELQLLQNADKEKERLIKKYKNHVLQLQSINYDNFLSIQKNIYNRQQNPQLMQALAQKTIQCVLQKSYQTNLQLFRSIDSIFGENCFKNNKNFSIISAAKMQNLHKLYGFNTRILCQHIRHDCDYNTLYFCQSIIKSRFGINSKHDSQKINLSLKQILMLLEKLSLKKYTSMQYQKKINFYLSILKDIYLDTGQVCSQDCLRLIQQYLRPEISKSNQSTFYQPSIKNRRLINCMSLLQNKNNQILSARSMHQASSTQKIDSIMISPCQALGCIYYYVQNQFNEIKKQIHIKSQVETKKNLAQIVEGYFKEQCIKKLCFLSERLRQQWAMILNYCQQVSKYQQIKYFSVDIRYRTIQLLFDMFIKKQILAMMGQKMENKQIY